MEGDDIDAVDIWEPKVEEDTPLRKKEKRESEIKLAWLRSRNKLRARPGTKTNPEKRQAYFSPASLPVHEVFEIQRLRKEGKTYTEIVKVTGRSLYCIHKYVKRGETDGLC